MRGSRLDILPRRACLDVVPASHTSPASVAMALLAIAGALGISSPAVSQDLAVEGLRTEYQQNPIGIDVRAPRLSWRILSSRRGTMQSAYEIRVATDSASLARASIWNSGTVHSTASILRPYGGPAVKSGTRYYWQVRIWDDAG